MHLFLKSRYQRILHTTSTVALAAAAFSVSGCVTAPNRTAVPGAAAQKAAAPAGRTHRVEKGETLWRIAKLYGIELQDLVEANHITDSTQVSTGQVLVIPAGGQPAATVPLASSLEDDEFIWPLRGKVLAGFGDTWSNCVNRGLTIAPVGHDTVQASRGGTVVFYNENFLDLGKTVIIEHPDGFWTVYARNAEVFVKVGDPVTRGTVIARAGRAGRDPAVYLYFEIRKGHLPQNPNFYLPR